MNDPASKGETSRAPAVFRRASDCPTESWRSSETGFVDWWTLFSADRTPTRDLTVGIAEIPVGAPRPDRGHQHTQTELYFIISGSGEVTVNGETTAVAAGDAVLIPGDAEHVAVNTGSEPLRLLYAFATDSFTDVVYRFPGQS